ncbi:MAG: phosphate ABC transporter ATP-binding protein [Bacteriovoracaceae bacterium]
MKTNRAVKSQDLNLWYGDFHALKNVSLNIAQGEITALIGPSGCGKTTFLKCLNRINERSGNVKVDGILDVFGANIYNKNVSMEALRKEIGMVFQRPNPLPLSIYDNIVFGVRTHHEKNFFAKEQLDRMVEEALRKVYLWDNLKNRLHESALDLQMEAQQKLCIARLLPLKPKLILLDEPCSALDPSGTEAIEKLLKELAGEYTIIIVTHSMAQARRVSDSCIFMLLGEIVEHTDTETIFVKPKADKTLDYIEGRFS